MIITRHYILHWLYRPIITSSPILIKQPKYLATVTKPYPVTWGHYPSHCWMSQPMTEYVTLQRFSDCLTHWGRVTHICVGNLTSIGPDNGLPPSRRQAIIWTKCWDIVNWTLTNKLQWNFNPYSNIFIQENAFENVVCEMASILSRPQCVKTLIYVFSYIKHGPTVQWTADVL